MNGALLSITIDVDGAAGLPRGGAGYEHRLSSVSERTYGVRRGLPRILDVLDEFSVAATFYVPGVTALRHRDEVAALAATRHEIGHHGHTHRRPDELDPDAQRQEIADGVAALLDVTGKPPTGYRAPGWELTPDTVAALCGAGFRFDSSLMGDDRPHVLCGDHPALIELPVHWALDDAPHFVHSTDVAGLLSTWLAELSAAAREGRHTTFTCHPEIIGRGHRIDVLRRLLDAAAGQAIDCVTHAEAAKRFAAGDA